MKLLRNGAAWVALALSLTTGCTGPQHTLGSALRPVRGHPLGAAPGRAFTVLSFSLSKTMRAFGGVGVDAKNASEVMADLDKAIQEAKTALSSGGEDAKTPAHHDQVAWVIPLALLAKAEIQAQLNQLSQAESSCWEAIRQSEEVLGSHIPAGVSTGDSFPFGAYHVFCRREKVRRHGFLILKEAYRRAGERDLELLMEAQVKNSDFYLTSSVAHGEETFVRIYECADWHRLGENTKAEVEANLINALIISMMVLGAAAAGFQDAQLQQQQMMTTDPAIQSQLQQQRDKLKADTDKMAKAGADAITSNEQARSAAIEGNRLNYQATIAGAMRRIIDLLGSSELVRNLPAFASLRQRVEQLDAYIQRNGFDPQAALALHQFRKSLDELSLQAQRARVSR